MVCGVYKIENKINGLVYIGQSINIKKRWSRHKRELNNNIHGNAHLQRAWNKYGSKSFSFELIKACKPRYLDRFEKLYIRINGSKSRNKTGYYRVSKLKDNHCKQGFIWRYIYFEDGKQKVICSVDINKLEEKVKNKGLKWLKFKEESNA